MQKFILPFGMFFSLLFAQSVVKSQQVLVLDRAEIQLGEGQKLPANEPFAVRGSITDDTRLVEMRITDHHDTDFSRPQQAMAWRRPQLDSLGRQFVIHVPAALRGNQRYTVDFRFYRALTASEQDSLISQIKSLTRAYVEQSVEIDRRSINFRYHPREMKGHLDQLLSDGLEYYRQTVPHEKPQFSNLVLLKLEQMRESRLATGHRLFADASRDSARAAYFNESVDELLALISTETQMLLNGDLSILSDRLVLEDIRSEKTPNTLHVHAGYGAVFFNALEDDPGYDQGFTAGLTFPLGNRAFSSKFWSKSALSAGVFLTTVREPDGGARYGGPLVGLPIYASYGYQVIDFIRLNGGVTLLEAESGNPGLPELSAGNNLYLSPMVSVQIDLSLWVDFLRR